MSGICYKSQLTRCGAKWVQALAPAKDGTQASLCCSIFKAPGVFFFFFLKNLDVQSH